MQEHENPTSYDVYIKLASGVETLYEANITALPYILTNPVPMPDSFKVSIKAKDAKGNVSVEFSPAANVTKIQAININETNNYVGIGIVPAMERLHVAGNLKIEDGTLIFKGTPPMGTHIKTEVGDVKIGSNITLDAQPNGGANRITYLGSALEFFTPVQGEWNDNKPVLSLSQHGEIEFNSSPYLKDNALYVGWKGDYKNGLKYTESYGGATNFKGPILFGENGGALGSAPTNHWDAANRTTALKWDATGKVGIGVAGALTEKLEVNGNVKITGGIYMKNAFQPASTYYSNDNFISFGHPGVSEDFIGYRNNTFYMMDSDGGGDQTHPDLVVGGNIRALKKIAATEVIVNTTATIPDYVFEKGYKLPTLEETKKYLDANKHLPYIKSAKELEKEGVNLMEMNNGMLRQMEELYLHVIRLEAELKELKKR